MRKTPRHSYWMYQNKEPKLIEPDCQKICQFYQSFSHGSDPSFQAVVSKEKNYLRTEETEEITKRICCQEIFYISKQASFDGPVKANPCKRSRTKTQHDLPASDLFECAKLNT